MSQSAYAAPEKLSDVVALLATEGSHILAGGQNLLVEPHRSRLDGSLLVDLRKLKDLSGINANNGGLTIGAMTTIGAIAASKLVRETCPVLSEIAGSVGDAQLRNRATLGGAIAEADPGSDLIPVLMVLNATFDIAGPKTRSAAADEFFPGPNRTALSAGEVITAVTIPAPAPSSGSAYEKTKDPATLYALCGVAAAIALSPDGLISDSRVAVTGSSDHPVRLRAVETALKGSKPAESLLASAARHADAEVTYRGNFYASSQYREHLTRVMTERALRRAAERATRQT